MVAQARFLVTDGAQPPPLAIVRSLGRAGYRCGIASDLGRSLAGPSRFAAGDIPVGDPAADPDAYVDAVARGAAGEEVGLLIPVTEAAFSRGSDDPPGGLQARRGDVQRPCLGLCSWR